MKEYSNYKLYEPTNNLLLVVQPDAHATNFQELISKYSQWIEEKLTQHGAILFRGFEVNTAEKLSQWIQPLTKNLSSYSNESSPRSKVLDSVYTSTDYPPEYPIQFHNEYSYANEWPMKLFFCCVQPSLVGGFTPISDSCQVLSRLRPQTVGKFRALGVRYVRNFIPGWGVSWQSAFQSEDQNTVEQRLMELGLSFEWNGSRLRTFHKTDAILAHPVTKRETWFNHAFFFNVRSLEPQELRESLLEEDEMDLSTQTYYGDGSTIEPEVIEEIRNAYREESICFAWEKGDLLLIDNMLVSHSRTTYEGKRELLVMMSDRMSRL